jgi:dipeptidase D
VSAPAKPGTSPFAGLEPAGLWRLFEELAAIPRPSKREEAVLAWIDAWAARHAFEVRRDAAGNRVVRVPAAPGREGAPTVALQAHVDMVTEKHSWSTYDPDAGRLLIVRDGDWIVAPETTLGADNGIGVVLMMHLATLPDLARGPLELLFTVDEETGLTGARELDPSLLTARTLLNLDSEEDGILYIGCAGGGDGTLHWTGRHAAVPSGWSGLRLSVSGFLGGHSGGDIHRNRGNALKALARVLRELETRTPARLAAVSGGNKRNAIPREAEALLAVPPGAAPAVAAAVEVALAALRARFGAAEPDIAAAALPVEVPAAAFDESATSALVTLLTALPNGVLAMSRDIPGLVETSTNLAVAETTGPAVRITTSSRSSVGEEMDEILATIEAIGRQAGCRIEVVERYGGWKPNRSSRVVGVAAGVHERLFGAAPPVTAIHAGLECGLFARKLPDLDMVSLGPDIRGPHAPGERVSIPSTAKCVRWVAGILEELAGTR